MKNKTDKFLSHLDRLNELGSELEASLGTGKSDVQDLISELQNSNDELHRVTSMEQNNENLLNKPKNVYSLADYRKTNEDFTLREPKKPSLNFPFVIQALNPEDAFCMAVNLHEVSGRYAFLTIENLSESTFSSKKQFEDLGPMTVYIDDICDLDLDLQKKISECLSERESARIPQVILGTTDKISTLKNSPLVYQPLLKKLLIGYLHMDKPFAHYKNGDLIRFFAEALQARLTMEF